MSARSHDDRARRRCGSTAAMPVLPMPSSNSMPRSVRWRGDDPRGAGLLERQLRMPVQIDVEGFEVDESWPRAYRSRSARPSGGRTGGRAADDELERQVPRLGARRAGIRSPRARRGSHRRRARPARAGTGRPSSAGRTRRARGRRCRRSRGPRARGSPSSRAARRAPIAISSDAAKIAVGRAPGRRAAACAARNPPSIVKSRRLEQRRRAAGCRHPPAPARSPAAAGWGCGSRLSNSGLAPMCAMSRWPSATRCSVARRATATSSTVSVVSARVGPADRDHRQVELEQPLGLVVAELDRDRDDAVDALAAQERLEDRRGAAARSAVRL